MMGTICQIQIQINSHELGRGAEAIHHAIDEDVLISVSDAIGNRGVWS